jgi:hypothetical protein
MINKKNIFVSLVSLCIVVGLFGFAYANGNNNSSQNGRMTNAKNFLSNKTLKMFGETKIKSEEEMNGKEIFLAEDNKYQYKIGEKKVHTLQLKDYSNTANKNGKTTKTEAIEIAKKLIEKYNPVNSNCTYILETANLKNTDNEKFYDLVFCEVASTGVKTGEAVAIDINLLGEMVGLATHEGNAEIALNSKPQITKEKAENIASTAIKNKLSESCKLVEIKKIKSELTVWNNKLCWSVKIDPIITDSATYGYFSYVNAINGTVEFDDYYCAIERGQKDK